MRRAGSLLVLLLVLSSCRSTTVIEADSLSNGLPEALASPTPTAESETELAATPVPTSTSQPSGSLADTAAAAASTGITVTPTTFDETQVDLMRFTFELLAAGVASRAPEPVDELILIEPVAIDTPTMAAVGYSTQNDSTTVVLVPGERPTDFVGFAAILERDSAVSMQAVMSGLLHLDEGDRLAEATWALQLAEPLAFDSAKHSVDMQKPVGMEDQDVHWLLTVAPSSGEFDNADLVQAAMAVVPPDVLNPPPAARATGIDDVVLTSHHLPEQLGDLRFGITLDAFTAETGVVGVPSESDNRTYVEQDFASGDIERVTYAFYKPDHVLYQVIIDLRGTEPQVTDLALRSFGTELTPEALIDVQNRATSIFSHGRHNASWLLPTPDHFDVWAWTFDSSIVATTTMPGTEFGFQPEG